MNYIHLAMAFPVRLENIHPSPSEAVSGFSRSQAPAWECFFNMAPAMQGGGWSRRQYTPRQEPGSEGKPKNKAGSLES